MSMEQYAGTCQEDPQCAGAQMMSPQGHANIVSASTHSPYWKAVRKGIAVAFRANNMKCAALLTAGKPAHILGPCSARQSPWRRVVQRRPGQQLLSPQQP